MTEYISREEAQAALDTLEHISVCVVEYSQEFALQVWRTIDHLYSELDRLERQNAKLREENNGLRAYCQPLIDNWADTDDDLCPDKSTGSYLADSLLVQEARASVALDKDPRRQTHCAKEPTDG